MRSPEQSPGYIPGMAEPATYLVTGANRGIGRALAQELARRGGRVVLACRNLAAGEDAEEAIRRETGNRELYVVELDLASLTAVREAATDLLDRFDRLDVLVNNAGVFTHERYQTADGFELQMGVNHLGHFLFTHELRDLLLASAPARVVTLTSRAHFRGKLDLAAVEAGGARPYQGYQAYSDSKLANLLFALELARRLEGTRVTSNAVHPGTVNTQMLADYLHSPPVALDAGIPVEEGAATPLWAATAPELETVTGQYFEHSAVAEPARSARDPELARRVWAWSLRVTGQQESDWGS